MYCVLAAVAAIERRSIFAAAGTPVVTCVHVAPPSVERQKVVPQAYTVFGVPGMNSPSVKLFAFCTCVHEVPPLVVRQIPALENAITMSGFVGLISSLRIRRPWFTVQLCDGFQVVPPSVDF